MNGISPITAILVTYNSADVIAQALQPLVSDPAIASVIVVDNCSTDDTCQIIKRNFPRVTILKNDRNEGFGRANNLALKKVQTPYALLVNPDAVMEKAAAATLRAAADRYPDAALLAPALYDETGALHQSHKRSVFNREQFSDIYTEPEGDCCAEFLSGAVWLLNMKHLNPVAYFDPNIFLYYEDDDICLRLRKAGHGLVLVPAAKAMHLMGGSSGGPNPKSEFFKQSHLAWSRLYMEKKYKGDAAFRRLSVNLYLLYSLKAAMYCLLFNKDKLNRYRGRLAGIFDFNQHPISPQSLS